MGNPPVNRAILILDFLTTHPGRGFTLSEMARRLQIHKSTAHGILTTLTDRALVQRNPSTFEYRLGPALVPMGTVAAQAFPALRHAKREATQLAAEHDADCVIAMVTGEEILIVGRAGVGGPLSVAYIEGQRHPLVPPLGSVLLAWEPPAAVEAWLDRLDDPLSEHERDYYRNAVSSARRRGHTIEMRAPQLGPLAELDPNGHLYSAEGRSALHRVQAALARDHRYLPVGDAPPPDAELNSIAAPVFGPDENVLLAIALLTGEHGQYHGRDVPWLARSVVHAAARVTAAVNGRPPAPAQRE